MEVSAAIRIAIVNDFDVVVQGLAQMLRSHAERVQVVEVSTNAPATARVDIALVDTFAQHRDVNELLAEANADRLVVYSWSLEPELIRTWARRGVVGFIDKRSTPAELVVALEEVFAGRAVPARADDPTTRGPGETAETDRQHAGDDHGDWPGSSLGLSARESEVIALIAIGLSNDEVARRAYLSINTVKSYIRSAYRKMDVTSRSRAILWALDHGFRPSYLPTRVPDDLL